MPDDPPDEELLVTALQDPAAFGAFYRRHSVGLLAFFARRTRDPEAAADLTAEAFAAALAGLRRFDSRRGSGAAWLYGIARHLLLKWQDRGHVEDRARRRLGVQAPPPDDETLESIERLSAQDAAAVRRALEELPADQRAAIDARILEGRGYDEIARVQDASRELVRQRVSRGLATLRRRLGREIP